MKEKIIEICKAVEIHIQKSEEYQACIGMGRFTERFNEIIHVLNPLVNQEVERRIKERMSDDEIKSIALRYAPIMMYAGITCMEDVNLSIRQDVIEMLVNLRSRLTNVVSSQKTEGGTE